MDTPTSSPPSSRTAPVATGAPLPPPVPRARVAVVGCGAIAYEHLAFLSASHDVDLVAACDVSPASAEFAVRRYGAGRAFTDLDTMLREVRPDVVHVLTPPHTHEGVVAACLSSGAHVLCEKPAAPTTDALRTLVAMADRAGRRFTESQNMRYNQPVLELCAARDQGRLGEVREVDLLIALDFVSGRFGDRNLSGPSVRLPGGAVHDFLPHLAYLFLLLAGQPSSAPIDHVSGVLRNASGNPRVLFDHLDALVVSGDVRGRLRLASDLAPDAFRVVVRGTEASLETDLYHPYLRAEGGPNTGQRIALEHVVSGARLAWSGFTDIRDKVKRQGPYHGLARMLDDWYGTLRRGAPAPVTTADMLASSMLVDRLVELGGAS